MLRLRGGDGSKTFSVGSVNMAKCQANIARFFDGKAHVLGWSIDTNTGSVQAWIDNEKICSQRAGGPLGSVPIDPRRKAYASTNFANFGDCSASNNGIANGEAKNTFKGV